MNVSARTATPSSAENLIRQLRVLTEQYIAQKDVISAQLTVRKLLQLDNNDVNARYLYAHLIMDGTHKTHAQSRDLLLSILKDHPEIYDDPTEGNLQLIRDAACRCANVGPNTKAIELFRKLAPASKHAGDHFLLSEVLDRGDLFEESIMNLEKAIALDPATYDTPAHRETLSAVKARARQANSKTEKKKIGRYPDTTDFLGDFQSLIRDHIAVNLRREEKFVSKDTKFFTMGSCFARNLAKSLRENGYLAAHTEISEHVNTTFANRLFVDLLSGAEIDPAVHERFAELLPSDWRREDTVAAIMASNVFILTLGVAPAFFDRDTGAFVLPRPSTLNSRALAEKYQFRTTSVAENVANVLHVINFVRKIAPKIKIVVTVSPVPLVASFEHESAVQADCLSKSTMRLVAHEIVNNSNIENIFYWPSFEVFRWAGSNASNYYAADDGAAWHVSEDKVAGTIQAFVEMFSAR